MTLFGFMVGALLPRVLLLYYWFATNLIDRAFSTFIVPLIGVIVLPWTTLAYVWVYSPVVGGVAGMNWMWILLGFVADAFVYSLSGYRSTHRGVHV